MPQPQAFISTYAPRLRQFPNTLITPVIPQSTVQSGPKFTKRGTLAKNYSEDLLDNDDFDESDAPRRPTGLRSRREELNPGKEAPTDRVGTELIAPVQVQGIWRDWMGKAKYGKSVILYGNNRFLFKELRIDLIPRNDKQLHAQAELPYIPIPIRIELDISSYTPHPALPLPSDVQSFGINPALPAYKAGEPTLPSRVFDFFLWNLYEFQSTPDQFALTMVHELDLPTHAGYATQISTQIRQQLEEHAPIALHPLFQTNEVNTGDVGPSDTTQTAFNDQICHAGVGGSNNGPGTANPNSRAVHDTQTNTYGLPPNLPDFLSGNSMPDDFFNYTSVCEDDDPDDAYRCILNIGFSLGTKLFTDKFEWNLLHKPGKAEKFAKVTCAEIGLGGEWVPAYTMAIHEAVLKLKKEVIESGGILGGGSVGEETENMSLESQSAGWRYDPEHLCDEWAPKLENLSKEEIEKREGDRERQIRRQRRENAKFSSTTGVAPIQCGLFDQPENPDTPMGRGERSKKKRRFRSLSPLARGATPGGAQDAGLAGYSVTGATLQEW